MTAPKTKFWKKSNTEENGIGLLFSMPWIIGFIAFQLYPIIQAIYLSFTEYNLFDDAKWVGLKNYVDMVSDANVYLALRNTLYMAVIGLPITILVSIGIALLLNFGIKGLSFFRTIYYLPSIVPLVAAASVFIWVLNPEFGLFSQALSPFGITVPSFITDPAYTKPGLIIMDSWRSGQTAIIILAALQAIPRTHYEAADLDGANAWDKFYHITLPGISPTLLFVFITGLIGSLQYFTQGFVFSSISNGASNIAGYGPAGSLLFYATYLYNTAFKYMKFGYASALAMVLLVLIIILTLITFAISRKAVNYATE
ncbi:ABC transporter permease subunit [Schleiferilactobacillus harbinensis]|jgi:multiple sugar transport system permease protein|nr:sugar ABC transporter permease [Schleiferilactobacillus harbinensis]HAY53795.1 sugar ABC transporter permease [Lactobacillus sp.]MCI1686525.1 sugar ABC transporter permease [Schleiferilactobacillus harbinensis]MCI1782836.1 sugar ABC transporter permease [Schleiferilactobacillus harbinensis]MCI1850789.1 sugar ABC transporter permease [Schleiferilactobacillus harbinensis]QEU47826.1 sugar ABC transporter permease [Schleiferilactobacillus harbinensis]